MFDLLVKVIGTSGGKVQQLAQDAFLQLGMASSGLAGKLVVFFVQINRPVEANLFS